MPVAKRKSDGATAAVSKRTKVTTSTSVEGQCTKDELNDMSKDEIIAYALELQGQLNATPKPKELSQAEIDEKADKASSMLIKGIEKLMTVSITTSKPMAHAHELL